MSTSAENANLEVAVGTTAKGAELVITTTPTGMYRVEHRGVGAPPAITQELFTSLHFAKRAVDQFRRGQAARVAIEAVKQKVINAPSRREQLKAEALALQNGELKTPDTDEE